MEKKIFAFLLFGMILLSVSSVSALELNPFADKKIYEPILKEDLSDFIKEDFNSQYGAIKISKTLFWIETDKIAEYSLIENTEQCLINCEARGKAVLYESGQLFDDLRFVGLKGNEKELNAKYFIKEIETYEVEVPDTYKEVCSTGNVTKGELIAKETCTQQVASYKKESREREVWNEYKGQVLAPGQYEWKILADKRPTEVADFIPIARGKNLNEWAWWNGDWSYYQQINISNPTGVVMLNLTTINMSVNTQALINAGKMQNDCDDLRIVYADTLDSNRIIENCNSTTTRVIFNTKANISIGSSDIINYKMYYGNALASNPPANDNESRVYIYKDNFVSQFSGWATSGTISFSGGILSTSSGWATRELPSGWYDNMQMTGQIANTGNDNWGCASLRAIQGNLKGTGVCSAGSRTGWVVNSGLVDSGVAVSTGTYYNYQINLSSSNYVNMTISTANRNTATTDTGRNITFYAEGGNSHGYKSLVVRSWYLNEPTATLGTEQTSEGVSVVLSSPANAFNSNSQTIYFNATITPTNANITNVTWKGGAQTDFQAYNTNATITPNWTKTFADGSYSWNVTACWIGVSETESCTESTTRTFTIDSVAPNLTLNAPLTNFTTLTLPINVTLNFTASDSNLGSCWFSSSMNSTNTTFTCNTTQTIAFNSSGAHSFTYYANDTFGGVSTGTAPFYIYYVQPSATATNPITEGGFSTNTLWVNMTNIKFFPTTAWLIWNGTNYGAGTLTNVSNDSVRFDKTFIVPSINGTLANWTWFYNISGNPSVTNWNVSGAQNYISINISECGAGTYQILNYTLYDQKTRVISPGTNASIETDLTLTSEANSSQTWTFHTTKTGSNNLLICLPSGALNNSEYQLDSIAKYSYQDHVVQYHYIVNFNLNSSTIPQSIKLYDLATAESTSFLLNYQDENYLYVEDAVIDVWRRYVGDGVFVSVEHGKTDAQGQTRLHLVTEDIIYKFLVWIDGELVYTSPEYLALCQATPCQINLRKSVNDSDGFSERDNILFDYEFDKTTRTATFDFSTKDGTETTINMTILSSNAYANETACTTILTTSGGQVSCVIPTAFTNTTYQTIIYKDGEYFGTSFDSLAPSSMEIFGYTGIILTAIGYLFLALMGISSGIATIVFGIIGLALMGIVQVFESGSIFGFASAILWLIVAGVIIIIKITKRRIQ